MPVSSAGACHECVARSTESACVPQGLVAGSDATDSKYLRKRITFLETQLARLVQSTENIGGASEASTAQAWTSSHAAIESPTQTQGNGDSGSEDEDQEEQAVETGHAPLIRLLGNPIMGETPSTTQTPGSSDGTSGSCTTAKIGLRKTKKHQGAVAALRACIPSEKEMETIFNQYSSWWPLYRDTLGLLWGKAYDSLRSFAGEILRAPSPSALALLLVSFAIGTGDRQRFLPVVEKTVVNDDEYASTEAGLNCLMAVRCPPSVVIVFIEKKIVLHTIDHQASALQPRRAFLVYRRATSLLQLSNMHSRRTSDRHDAIFWPLFHADRWASLMIGLPYSLPDHIYDPGDYLYKRLGIITGKVIDCLQSIKGAHLSATIKVEEEMEAVKSQLPSGYLDLNDIRMCTNLPEKYTRLYRVVHFHQLRAYVHLPFFFRSEEEPRYDFSRRTVVEDSTRLLEAPLVSLWLRIAFPRLGFMLTLLPFTFRYLEVFETDPVMASNGTVMNFTAFTAAVVLLLDLVGYGAREEPGSRPHSAARDHKLHLVYRTLDAIKAGSETKISGLLCRKCYESLQHLLRSAYDVEGSEDRFVLPYFGVITMIKKGQCESLEADMVKKQLEQQQQSTPSAPPTFDHTLAQHLSTSELAPAGQANNLDMHDPNFGLGMSFAYQGPFLAGSAADYWGFEDSDMMNFATHTSMGWNGDASTGADWNWLNSDLPPNLGL
ncbi:uncharacterized protein MYCFIDRAFT_174639 [Pseudocercospora fijiensis CIRAD86]|uniref:Transcription factor domain-containing protein n=1 Tax=Pseudocercospora fijiensis (strain CIRAD86) TaxID=383855 RepID=M3AEX3_PSEFD|nr:uncharacterized protein MYCFIDRAFT_174639 [Pseudocercospora fijiensis CIRAD86]EME83161.1 hypothetical protein MYCFIDRAFT_174639 [Pseudocercospora fijiensis CIRAD86]